MTTPKTFKTKTKILETFTTIALGPKITRSKSTGSKFNVQGTNKAGAILAEPGFIEGKQRVRYKQIVTNYFVRIFKHGSNIFQLFFFSSTQFWYKFLSYNVSMRKNFPYLPTYTHTILSDYVQDRTLFLKQMDKNQGFKNLGYTHLLPIVDISLLY